MTASARQRSRSHEQRVPHLPKPVADSSSQDDELATAAVASGPFLLACSLLPASKKQRPKSKAQDGGGRNARATRRARARFWIVPRRFTLENHRLPLALPQSFGKLRKLHVFAEPTLGQFVAPRNIKNGGPCAETVDDESSLWKPEEI